MKKVLMVCLGNICRSPLAEGILKSKVDSNRIEVSSAGTGGWHVGELPDPRSIEVANAHGLDITDQRGKQFSTYDFEIYDHIFVMDKSNYRDVIKLATTPSEEKKVQLILEEIHPGEKRDVPDPYHGGDQGFKDVYNMLDAACDKIARRL
ncbi:low molecular weight phosphotyrosine protein phosphatase [Rasiella rasia]|uniref:protein-tyrosine-phosphatase n=1 Tax=Rasiella rasia TaxID=2744027 RepID=A0A6G6GQ81_9FLAO|nr:low molecular weight protein-tyrosine-phosphatase [Rasiella rasia]QIE60697.1 low molecular weight phosphotyrosine protein phosphatase [Rasiella rasia]